MSMRFELQLAEKWTPKAKGDVIEGEILSLSSIPWKDSSFPILILEDQDGCPWAVNMGCYVLQKVWENPIIQPGGYLGIQYRGESMTIESCGNHAKMYGVAYYKPGDWQRTEDGSVTGKQTSLGVIRELKPSVSIVKQDTQRPWTSYDQDDSDEPFNPEIPERIEEKVRGAKKK